VWRISQQKVLHVIGITRGTRKTAAFRARDEVYASRVRARGFKLDTRFRSTRKTRENLLAARRDESEVVKPLHPKSTFYIASVARTCSRCGNERTASTR